MRTWMRRQLSAAGCGTGPGPRVVCCTRRTTVQRDVGVSRSPLVISGESSKRVEISKKQKKCSFSARREMRHCLAIGWFPSEQASEVPHAARSSSSPACQFPSTSATGAIYHLQEPWVTGFTPDCTGKPGASSACHSCFALSQAHALHVPTRLFIHHSPPAYKPPLALFCALHLPSPS
jgi:hypothetical protein